MKRMWVAMVLPLFGMGSAAAEETGLRITLTAPAQDYILGEPIVFTQSWKNQTGVPIKLYYRAGFESEAVTLRSTGPRRKCGITETVKMVGCTHEELLVDQEVRRPLSISGLGIVDEGEHEVWIVYEGTSLPLACGWYAQRAESNHVRFRISKPQGVDAEVFNKFRQQDVAVGPGNTIGHCNQVALTEDAIKRFPTSTYVAYALFGRGRPGYPSPEIDPPDAPAEEEFMLLQRMLDRELNAPGFRPAEGPTYRRHHEEGVKKQRAIIDALEQLRRDFPTFAYRDAAMYALVRAYFRAGEPEKSVPVLKELFEKHATSDVATKAGAYKKVLVDHSLWPAPGEGGRVSEK